MSHVTWMQTFHLPTAQVKIARRHLMPRSSICIVDLPAFFNGNGLAHMDSVLAYGHRASG